MKELEKLYQIGCRWLATDSDGNTFATEAKPFKMWIDSENNTFEILSQGVMCFKVNSYREPVIDHDACPTLIADVLGVEEFGSTIKEGAYVMAWSTFRNEKDAVLARFVRYNKYNTYPFTVRSIYGTGYVEHCRLATEEEINNNVDTRWLEND